MAHQLTTDASDRVVETAGGVPGRCAGGGLGVEVSLVHRPKYDDWSLSDVNK